MALLNRVQGILLRPRDEWNAIVQEEPAPSALLTGYVLPLALFSAVCSVIGYGAVGYSVMGVHFGGWEWGIWTGVFGLLGSLIGVGIVTTIVNVLAPSFGAQSDWGRALQLVAYSWTPAWVGGIFSLYPALGWLGAVLGLYGLYVLFLGLPVMTKVSAEKHLGYFIVSLIVALVVYFIIGAVTSSLVWGIVGAPTVRFP
ncbi:MAG: Yip1 family protein [Chlorobiota bacterium]